MSSPVRAYPAVDAGNDVERRVLAESPQPMPAEVAFAENGAARAA